MDLDRDELTPEEERAFDELDAALDRAIQSLRETVSEARKLRRQLHQIVSDL